MSLLRDLFGQPAPRGQQSPPPDIVGGLFMGAIAFAAVFVPLFWGIISSPWIRLEPEAVLATIIPVLREFPGWPYYQALPGRIIFHIFHACALLAGGAALVAGFFAGRPAPAEIHVRGRELIRGRRARREASREMRREIKSGGIPGIEIPVLPAPIRIDQRREARHFGVIGGSGGGKTTIMRPLIDAARERGDKSIIYDFKTDFTQSLPRLRNNRIALIAPWDSRGHRWAVARDYQSESDARELAASLIPLPQNGDTVWASAARQVLAGLIRAAQVESGYGTWGWGDVIRPLLEGGKVGAYEALEKHYPRALLTIEDLQSKTTSSVFFELNTHLDPIYALADAWGDKCPAVGDISIRDWLLSDDPNMPRTLIIGGNQQFKNLQSALAQAVVNAFIRLMGSPEMPDVEPDKRRVWLFLDEFPQLGKIDNFGSFLDVGRSRGIRVVIGTQSISKLKSIYGDEEVEAWTANIGSWIITATDGRDAPKWIAEIIGKRDVKVWSPSYSAAGTANSSDFINRTDQYQLREMWTVSPSEVKTMLGANRHGVKYFYRSGGDFVYLLQAPHLSDDAKRQRREPWKPALWTRPDWPSCADQIADKLRDRGGDGGGGNDGDGGVPRQPSPNAPAPADPGERINCDAEQTQPPGPTPGSAQPDPRDPADSDPQGAQQGASPGEVAAAAGGKQGLQQLQQLLGSESAAESPLLCAYQQGLQQAAASLDAAVPGASAAVHAGEILQEASEIAEHSRGDQQSPQPQPPAHQEHPQAASEDRKRRRKRKRRGRDEDQQRDDDRR